MGQSSSQQLGQRSGRSASVGGTPNRMRFRSPFMRRKKHKVPLSAAFAAPHMGSLEALNINTATVEQLMTLPGVNRRIAQCIVDHRAAIGGQFQRIDDLALVPGMGAVKLEQIRPEICVKRRPGGSLQGSSLSSRTPSMESLLSEPSLTFRPGLLNVNTATVFQLQQVSGLNQELAANVVEYRKRKGPFKSLDDMARVKGLSPARLGAIRALLSLSDDEATPKTPRLLRHSSTVSSNTTPIRNGGIRPNLTPNRKSLSVSAIRVNGTPLTGLNGFRNVPVNDIYDLLGAYSHRPTVEGDFQFSRNGRRALRVASWNLDRMTKAKAENPGVLEVICRTILENKLSIICLQEILHASALARICEELNHPTLRRTIEWRENSRQWKIQTSGRDSLLCGLGFLYDSAQCDFVEAESKALDLKGCHEGVLEVPPAAYMATFRLASWRLSILNIYLKHYNLARIASVLGAVAEQTGKQEIFLVAGDFSGVRPRAKEGYKGWEAVGKVSDTRLGMTVDVDEVKFYKMLDVKTTAFYSEDALDVSQCNILCRESLPIHRNAFREAIYKSKSLFDKELLAKVPPVRGSASDRLTGHAAIIRQGLCHMAIPRGWTWGGPASEYCPVYVEVYQDAAQQGDGAHVTTNGDASSDLNSSTDSVFVSPK
ncbi:endonuclease/exonuclease/phosphatase family domain-containing protein 1-like [Lutzomyia longipalpis]|uniref:endonuclease/exonuclease/phosphatase family domain-containing protein 1-like n=1 Tax=Lutzomyia longipalpis TaxID=7200 RepID=UPI002483A02B|nr:endonuclease/exonuclease/phosphatase family domain-containing protein 1-like [Lutzomyia longipalpis]XP_055691975.1 endonuclease/exonuclease/phosphatase family domain-containing protein 1-like [Lutzomyia longipalpis]